MGRTRLIWLALRAHGRLAPGLMVAWVVTIVGAVALPVASAAMLGAVVGAVSQGRDAIVAPLAGLVAVNVVYTPCRVYGWAVSWAMGRRYRLAHRQRILRALVDEPGIAHVQDPSTLDAARAADNSWVVNMLDGVHSLAASRLTGLGAVGIVAVHQPVAGLVLLVTWTVMGEWRWRRVAVTYHVRTGQAQNLRRASAMSDLALQPHAAKEIRLFGLRGWIGARYAEEWLRAMETVWRERRAAARGATAVAALLFGGNLLALWLIARDAAAGRIGIGALAAVMQAVLMARELGEGFMGQWEIDYGLPLMDAVERLEAVAAGAAEPLGGDTPASAPAASIRFEDVRFSYPGSEREVLRGLDLEIPVGTSLAIVGENGAGKTTAVQLLARLRDPTGGRITIDGTDLRTLDAGTWHDRVAAVSQEAIRLPLSVRDNIGAGRTDDMAVLEQAARDAGVLGVITAFPAGWDTVLAKDLAGGGELSGGQWQRLALARGLVALETGADILVLDEPTAHLDVRAEADLYDRFLVLTRGRTTVLVSHRFSTVRRADRIAVLEAGRVAELGTHDELVALGGRYAAMFDVQAARFR